MIVLRPYKGERKEFRAYPSERMVPSKGLEGVVDIHNDHGVLNCNCCNLGDLQDWCGGRRMAVCCHFGESV